jgi:hypothetical protein
MPRNPVALKNLVAYIEKFLKEIRMKNVLIRSGVMFPCLSILDG